MGCKGNYIYIHMYVYRICGIEMHIIYYLYSTYTYIYMECKGNTRGIYIYIHSYIRSICGIDVKYKYVSIYIYISTVNQLLTGINIKVEISSPDHH
jgi:hypothetical protein